MVGEILKKRREELGRDLREISNGLKIRYDYLKALEDGNLQRLPAEVYIKGYIQEYAKVLNLEPESLVSAYLEQSAASLSENDKLPPQKYLRESRPKMRYVVVPALVAVFLIVAFFQLQPARKKHQPSTPLPGAIESQGARSLKAGNPELVLQALASDTTWLLVTIDETSTKEILMQPGDSVTWRAKKGFFLKIGNAGGIRLIFNGKEISRLGEKGQVLKINLPDSRI